MHEIERRFLARIEDGGALATAPGQRLEQGYLSSGDPSVRVRRLGEEWMLTVKSGRGLVRREVEAALPPDVGAALLEIAGVHRLAKLRHRLGRWEVDVFQEALTGLVLAEVELSAPAESLPPPPPGIALLREVTEDGRFVNQALAGLGASAAAAFVAAAYERG